MKKLVSILFLLLALSSCVSRPVVWKYNPPLTEMDMFVTREECWKQHHPEEWIRYVSSIAAAVNRARARQAFLECMEKKGFTIAE